MIETNIHTYTVSPNQLDFCFQAVAKASKKARLENQTEKIMVEEKVAELRARMRSQRKYNLVRPLCRFSVSQFLVADAQRLEATKILYKEINKKASTPVNPHYSFIVHRFDIVCTEGHEHVERHCPSAGGDPASAGGAQVHCKYFICQS